MTGENQSNSPRFVAPSEWSNRVILLALAGILFLTIYPFRFTLYGRPLAHSSPFFLGGFEKEAGALDVVLNILLFLPFGFGLAERSRERGRTREAAFFFVAIAGFLVSYSVEFLQQFTPTRQSRWEDVLTNTIGSIAGFLLFELCGDLIVARTVSVECALRAWLTPRRAALLLPIYFVFGFALSAMLQKETRLTDWNPDSVLLIGNDAVQSPRYVWMGTISRVQIWNSALPENLARSVTSGETLPGSQSNLLASYNFLSLRPFQDQMQLLPDLSAASNSKPVLGRNGLILGSQTWLISQRPVSSLIADIQRTNQFSLELACTPARIAWANVGIVSISHAPGLEDFSLRQKGTALVISIRNPITIRHDRLAWSIPDLLLAGQHRDILFSYDGSRGRLYVDGSDYPGFYALGPSVRVAALIRSVNTAELAGYGYIYYALIFIPAGALFGMAIIQGKSRDFPALSLLAALFILSPWLLYRILSHVSGSPPPSGSIALSLVLLMAGALWINADRSRIPAAS